MPPSQSDDPSTTLSNLSLNTTAATTKPRKKPAPIADSWEDASSDTETEPTPSTTTSNPKAPPPTPASPTAHNSFPDYAQAAHPFANLSSATMESRDASRSSERRPDKTTSAASRMIAAGLGVRAPKRTEEEREYDRAMREKQAREKEDRKKEELERQRAKAAIWED